MARKVFISFLGTSNYLSTYYTVDGVQSKAPTRFIQEAILDSITKDWTSDDKIFIFQTKEAFNKNWKNDGHGERATEPDQRIGFKEILNKKPYSSLYQQTEHILEGFNNEDIWSIFYAIYNQLEKGDEIYFDITHAFRSIPIFTNTLLNYSRVLKDVKVKKIYYGAFEKLGLPYKVSKMPIEERIAPVLDLTDIVQLQNWTMAATDFITNGKTEQISELLIENNKKLNPKSQEIRALKNIQLYFETGRSKLITEGNAFVSFKQSLKSFKRKNKIKPLNKILERINNRIEPFKKDSLNNVEHAIEWCFEYGMYQQAITMGHEYLLTLVVTHLLGDKKAKNKNYRTAMNSFLTVENSTFENPEKWNFSLSRHSSTFIPLIENEIIKILREPTSKSLTNKTPMGEFGAISDVRNQINHGGVTDNTTPDVFVSAFKKEYDKALNKIHTYINNNKK